MNIDSTPVPPLRELARAAHIEAARERAVRLAEEERARQAALEADRTSPDALGLEECEACGWWRDPLPPEALGSTGAFRTYLAMARVRCMCTATRCHACGELMSERVPTPDYFNVDRGTVVRSGGLAMGLWHRARCRAQVGGGISPQGEAPSDA